MQLLFQIPLVWHNLKSDKIWSTDPKLVKVTHFPKEPIFLDGGRYFLATGDGQSQFYRLDG